MEKKQDEKKGMKETEKEVKMEFKLEVKNLEEKKTVLDEKQEIGKEAKKREKKEGGRAQGKETQPRLVLGVSAPPMVKALAPIEGFSLIPIGHAIHVRVPFIPTAVPILPSSSSKRQRLDLLPVRRPCA